MRVSFLERKMHERREKKWNAPETKNSLRRLMRDSGSSVCDRLSLITDYFHRVHREPAIHSSPLAHNAKDSYEPLARTRRRTITRLWLAMFPVTRWLSLSRVGLFVRSQNSFRWRCGRVWTRDYTSSRIRGYFERYFEVHRRQFERSNRDLSNNRDAYSKERRFYADDNF